MAREKTVQNQIPNLHPVSDGFAHSYTGKRQEQGVIVSIMLDIVSPENFRLGAYRRNAYELVTLNPQTVSGRTLGVGQKYNAAIFEKRLREEMLASMQDAGWQQVGTTIYNQPIWVHQPSTTTPLVQSTSAQHADLEQKHGIVATSETRSASVQGEHQPKVYLVYGDMTKEEKKLARKTGQKPAYVRKVSTKTIPIFCTRCGQTVVEEHLPGAKPQYCKPCAEVVRKEKTLDRVKRYYAANPEAHKGSKKKSS
jgi:hypothetical protein